ncbi:MAG: prolyl oligopeptidase family serine peptidase [Saprospiraceae bacterium]|nr:prolyl oligopeptidase family serine peptidase [Saprospiraceae bacterium]
MRQIIILSILLVCANMSFGQNGNIVSKNTIDITKSELWAFISSNDSIKSEYKFANNLNYSEIIYQSNSYYVEGFLITPKAKGHYPVIIFNRGGNREFNKLTLKTLFFSTAVLANEGYIILASNYRAQDEFGGKDFQDVLNLIHVADQLENADTSKIGMFGWSRGGMMTYMSLKESNRIKTAVIGNGASDLFSAIEMRPELERDVLSECIPNYWKNKEKELKKRSALFWADSLNKKSSLLLLCGSLDRQVDYQQSVNMAAKLASINYTCELKVYVTNHGFQGKRNELNTELLNWFNTHLKATQKRERTKISITIDDVPNTKKFRADHYRSLLLETLDSLNIPIAIFINEGLMYRTIDTVQNLMLLEEWAKRNFITLGNHTFSHLRYSDVTFDEFKKDVEKGEIISRQLANKFNKTLETFRFPYNNLGIDSIHQAKMDSFLTSMAYKIAPFTVESSDWMFNAVYEHYISNLEFEQAAKIGALYVSTTIAYVHYFDSLSQSIYGRNVNQIYLCHDNSINAKYLKEIIVALESEDYEFVSIKDAILDSAYNQSNVYYKKWGISWFYRWMTDSNIRKEWMKKEPDISDIETRYNTITK